MKYHNAKGLGKNPKSNYNLWEFDSLADLLVGADANTDRRTSNGSKESFGSDFFLTADYDEAREVARHGWDDIRPTVDQAIEPIREKLADILGIEMETYHDLIGAEPDIARYVAGELECMMDYIPQETPKAGKVFTLLVDATMTCVNKASDIAKRGATLCALVEAFSILGYELEVWTELTIRGYDDKKGFATVLTRVSSAGDPLDINNLMFCVGHPDYNRRIMWSFGETQPVLATDFGFTTGGYYGLTRNGAHYAERVGASCVVALDGTDRKMETDPVGWILDQLETQGLFGDADDDDSEVM